VKRINRYESKIRTILEGQGFTVLHRGVPDFLCFRLDKKRLPIDIAFIEVKSKQTPQVNEYQLQYSLVLSQLGLNVIHVMADDVMSIEQMLKRIKNPSIW